VAEELDGTGRRRPPRAKRLAHGVAIEQHDLSERERPVGGGCDGQDEALRIQVCGSGDQQEDEVALGNLLVKHGVAPKARSFR
jgi:hypothetical protein